MVRGLLVITGICACIFWLATLSFSQEFSGGEVITGQKTLKGDVFFALEWGGPGGGLGQFSYVPMGPFHLQKSGGEGICPMGNFLNPGCEFNGTAGTPIIFNVDAYCEVTSFKVVGTLRIGQNTTYNREGVYSQQLCNRDLADEFSAGGSLTLHFQ